MGWEEEQTKNNTEAMFSFTFAAEYAVLSRFAYIRSFHERVNLRY